MQIRTDMFRNTRIRKFMQIIYLLLDPCLDLLLGIGYRN